MAPGSHAIPIAQLLRMIDFIPVGGYIIMIQGSALTLDRSV